MNTKESKKTPELFLQNYWNNLQPGTKFTLANGHILHILSIGHQNKHFGPDFLDACLEINGVLRRGKVEMHCKTTDWISHGHSANKEYSDVILHVVMEDDTSTGNIAFLPDVPLLCISEKVIRNSGDSSIKKVESGNYCAHFFGKMEKTVLCKILEDAGVDRLYEKSKLFVTDLIVHSGKKTLLGALAVQYGVPDNREAFQVLARRLFSYPDPLIEHSCPAILWGESGLLPDLSISSGLSSTGHDIVLKLWEEWWKLRPDAGKILKFKCGCRPYNSPERRIAALAAWATAFQFDPLPELKKIIASEDPSTIINEFIERLDVSDFWKHHTSFQSKLLSREIALFPKQRLEGLLIDVILPFLLASAKLHHDGILEKQVVNLYHKIPPVQNNHIIHLMHSTRFANRKGLIEKAAIQQGMIHIYKRHCCENGNYCLKCAIYRSFTTDIKK